MTSPLSPIDTNSLQDNDYDISPRSQKLSVTTFGALSQLSLMALTTPIVSYPRESFLSGPIETLARTLENNAGYVTSHDVIESYNTLYLRLRALAHCDDGHATLPRLKDDVPTLAKCLRRDIIEGLSSFPRPTKPMSSDPACVPSLEEYEIQSSVDSSTLCQSALVLSSTLFSLPVLSDLVLECEQSKLLDPIIEICAEKHPSAFNANKIRAQAFLCLRAQSILKWISASHLQNITLALKSALDGDDENMVKRHAFKIIHSYLVYSPLRSLQAFISLLPKILVNLTSSSIQCRAEASRALCGYVIAKLTILDTMPDLVMLISNEVHDFLEYHGSRRSSVQQEYMFPATLRDALKDDDPAWDGYGPSWAMVTLTSLIVLGDAAIFSRPRSLRLILNALRRSSRHKITAIVALHAMAWKCAVWALSRCFIVSDAVDTKSCQDIFQRASLTLMQELKSGVGTCLVAALTQDPAANVDDDFIVSNIRGAVSIMKTLIAHHNPKLLREGVALLHRLIGCADSSGGAVVTPVLLDYIPAGLVDGTWLGATSSELDDAVTRATGFPLSRIRTLTEGEIITNWQDLSEVWALAAERMQPEMTSEQLGQLTEIWQGLLLCRARLTQGQQHLTASNPFAATLASLITRFLTISAESDAREKQLGLVEKWWRVIKNVFDSSWLSIPAEIVLAGILDRKIDLSIEPLKRRWCEVCTGLVSAGTPTLLHVLHTRVTGVSDQGHNELLVTRELWSILGSHTVHDGGEGSWTNLAGLLALPFHCANWMLNDAESKLWSAILGAAIALAQTDCVHDTAIVQSIIEQVEEKWQDRVHLISFEASLVLQRWYVVGENEITLRIMQAMGRFWNLGELSDIVSSISSIQNGVATWLNDEYKLTDEKEHERMVSAVYIPALEPLGRLNPKDPNMLSKLEPFLGSVFHKVAPLAPGPHALLEFWRKYYSRDLVLSAACPTSLFASLKGFSEYCGDSLADDLSVEVSSPSTVISNSRYPVSGKPWIPDPEHLRFADLADVAGFGSRVMPSTRAELIQLKERFLFQCKTPKASLHHPSSALDELQEYSSVRDDQTPVSSLSLGSSHEIPRALPQPPKRRLTEGDVPSKGRIEAHRDDRHADAHPMKRTKTTPGLISSSLESPSQVTPVRSQISGIATAGPLPPSEDEDDYESWEAGLVSHRDIRDIQQETGEPVTKEDNGAELVLNDGDDEEDSATEDVLLSPSVSDFPLHSRRRERSQTAPELASPSFSATAYPIPRAEPLRRHRSSYAQLDALQQAYAMVVESDGVSQMPVEELLQLKRLTSRIDQTVDERIYQQLERGTRGGSA